MLQILERVTEQSVSTLQLTLPFQERQRSRQRVTLSTGEHAALLLPRGSVLRGGDLLRLSDGRVVAVQAAPESVSTVRARDARALLRAAYHLGNRHVPLEVSASYLRYLHDHVLDAMVAELGLAVACEQAPFEPESGAYGRHTHGRDPHDHSHAHAHDHSHAHDHDQPHNHAHAHAHDDEHDRVDAHAHASGVK